MLIISSSCLTMTAFTWTLASRLWALSQIWPYLGYENPGCSYLCIHDRYWKISVSWFLITCLITFIFVTAQTIAIFEAEKNETTAFFAVTDFVLLMSLGWSLCCYSAAVTIQVEALMLQYQYSIMQQFCRSPNQISHGFFWLLKLEHGVYMHKQKNRTPKKPDHYWDTSVHVNFFLIFRLWQFTMCDVILLHKFMWSHRIWHCVFQKLAAECQSAGYSGTLIPYKCDLSNEEEILSMFSAIKTLHKGVDVCINNAGLAHNEPLLSGKTEGWRNMIDVGGSHTHTNKFKSVCAKQEVEKT